MGGLGAAVAAKGYAATTISDVCAAAQISKSTFYAQYADKEACFLDAYELGTTLVLEVVRSAARDGARSGATLEERLLASSRAYLTAMTLDPDGTRTFIVEVLGAGPAALAKRHEVSRRFAAQLRELAAEEGILLDPAAALFVVGGINELVLAAVVEDRTAQLPELAPLVARLVLSAGA